MIFLNQVKQNPQTKVKFAPGRNADGSYKIYVLKANYDDKVRGGMRHKWFLVADKLSLEEAKELLNKKTGVKIY